MYNENEASFRQLDAVASLAKIKRVQCDRHYRDKQRIFFAEGIRNFVAAADHGFAIDTLIYSEKLLIVPIARMLVRKLKRDGVPFARVSPEQFRDISLTERASGVAAIFRQRVLKLNELKPRADICWIALSNIRLPGNLGTLLRTAAAVGAAGIILIGSSIDPFEANVVRASMGAIFQQQIVRTNAERFRHWVKYNSLQVVGASPNGMANYDQIDYQPPTILMLGNERSGLTAEEESICQQTVRIPMIAGTDSLNVAVAGSLLLYEIFRAVREGNRTTKTG